jgi:hypothetical protein
MHKPYPGEHIIAEHDHDWADGFCQDPDCAALLIEDVEHDIVCSIDFGIRTVLDTYVDPITRLSFEIRSRVTCCAGCRGRLLNKAEADLATIREAAANDSLENDALEIAESILREWESAAGDYGLIGYADEGMYWIAAQR